MDPRFATTCASSAVSPRPISFSYVPVQTGTYLSTSSATALYHPASTSLSTKLHHKSESSSALRHGFDPTSDNERADQSQKLHRRSRSLDLSIAGTKLQECHLPAQRSIPKSLPFGRVLSWSEYDQEAAVFSYSGAISGVSHKLLSGSNVVPLHRLVMSRHANGPGPGNITRARSRGLPSPRSGRLARSRLVAVESSG